MLPMFPHIVYEDRGETTLRGASVIICRFKRSDDLITADLLDGRSPKPYLPDLVGAFSR